MRFETPRKKSDDERILPLVNIVFLLLIFFMLAGRLAASDPFDVAPPRSVSEGQIDAQDLLVLVGADGQLALDGEEIERGALQAAVAHRLEQSLAIRVRLKADADASATSVILILEILRDAGVKQLMLLTVPEAG